MVTVLLYDAEAQGSNGLLQPLKQAQLQDAEIFLGQGRLQPKLFVVCNADGSIEI